MTDNQQSDDLEVLRKGWLDQAARDASEIVRLELRIEELEATLGRIRQWCDAYPVGIFRPLTDEQIRIATTVLSVADISIGALHAQWGRHILAGIRDIITITEQE